jgi:NAD(P)-dependent dehydrogenase (short-subunit alcohol dehydrogenase family)
VAAAVPASYDNMSDHNFEGRVALVTAATRGIGLGIAAELARRGAQVAITGRKPEGLREAVDSLGGSDIALAVQGKADDEAHQADAVRQTIDRFGRLDILVNNAGINPVAGPLMEMPLDAVRKTVEVNVTAALAWTQQAWRAWLDDHGGAVLNVASIAGVRPGPFLGWYGISKAALIHLTKQLALELAPRVRVNAIAPGIVKTKFATALYAHDEHGVAAGYPLKRLGSPEDTAALAAFLLSDEASWITGQTVVIDGGVVLT